MKEKEFVDQLAQKWGVDKKQATAMLSGYTEVVGKTLLEHGEVTLNAMGKFVLQAKPAREARNPMTGDTVKVPAKTVAKWRPNKKFKDEVLAKAKPKKK